MMQKVTIKDLLNITGGKIINCNDLDKEIKYCHSLEKEEYLPNSFAFIKDKNYLDYINKGATDLVFLKEELASLINNPNVSLITVADPYVAFAKSLQLIDPSPKPKKGIHPTAIVPESCILGSNVSIGAYSVLGENCTIGDNTVIEDSCSLGDNCKLGKNVRLHPKVVLYHNVQLSDYVVVHSLSVLGSDGFGYANERGRWIKIPQIGTTRVGERTEIGALTSIDRGALKDTVVENDIIIDNHIHLGHNVRVGMGTAMAGGTIVAGSTTFGKYCIIGGASVFNGHIKINDFVTVGGMAMVPHSLTESHKTYSSGLPVDLNNKWLRQTVMLRYDNLLKQSQKIKNLEEEVTKLKSLTQSLIK